MLSYMYMYVYFLFKHVYISSYNSFLRFTCGIETHVHAEIDVFTHFKGMHFNLYLILTVSRAFIPLREWIKGF